MSAINVNPDHIVHIWWRISDYVPLICQRSSFGLARICKHDIPTILCGKDNQSILLHKPSSKCMPFTYRNHIIDLFTVLWAGTWKRDHMVFGLCFFKCACVVPKLSYIHACLPEASSRSLLHACGQQWLSLDCVYSQADRSFCWPSMW